MKLVAFIPAHMASVRFPGKVLYDFKGKPMIEHVRRRALLSKHVQEVFVATCDDEIRNVIEGYGGKVIMTDNTHTNGTTRVAQAVQEVDCSHVLLLQADEPLLLPEYLDRMAEAILASEKETIAWNAAGPIERESELDRHSFVKCFVNASDRILTCFRRSPCFADFEKQRQFIRKILGIIAYQREFLIKLAVAEPTPIEVAEFIEQMRMIELEHRVQSVAVEQSLPSVNEPEEANEVNQYLEENKRQQELLQCILTTDTQ